MHEINCRDCNASITVHVAVKIALCVSCDTAQRDYFTTMGGWSWL